MNIQTRKMTIREFREDPDVLEMVNRIKNPHVTMWMPSEGVEMVRTGAVTTLVLYVMDGALLPATCRYAKYAEWLAATPFDDECLGREMTWYVVENSGPDDVEAFVNYIHDGLVRIYPGARRPPFDPDDRDVCDLTKPL